MFETLLRLISLLLWLASGAQSAFSCPAGATGLYADPTDCSRFYKCSYRSAVLQTCPPGTLWNSNKNYCDWPYNVQCTISTGSSSTQATTPSSTQAANTNSGVIFSCPAGATGLYADPTDCSKFYKCSYGSAVLQTCPPGTLWNSNKNYCDWPYNVKCTVSTGQPSSSTLLPTTAPTLRPTTQQPNFSTTSTSSSATCSSMISITSSWSGNFGATLKIPLTRDVTIYTIRLTTDLPINKIQFWDADITPASGTTFTLTPKPWFGGQAAGSSLQLGFQVNYEGPTPPTFTSILLQHESGVGEDLCSGTVSSTAAPSSPPPSTSYPSPTSPLPSSSSTSGSTSSTGPSGSTSSTGCSQKKVVCYFPNWAYYRTGLGSHKVEDIDMTLCTHVIYSFAVLDENTYTMKVYDTWRDIDLKGYEKFVALRNRFPNKKYLIALGGWNDSRTSKYSTLLASKEKRANFVARAVEFIEKYGFDGLDLDYEYPAYQQSSSEKTTFAAWVRELKTAFEPRGWELTSAVAAGKSTIEAGYDVPEISKYLDAIHVMAYDMHGSWENQVDNHAPLYSSPGDVLSVDYAMRLWLSLGAPREKLIMGIPTYGRSWTLSSSGYHTLGSSASGGGSPGPIIGESGQLGYQEICLNVKENGWTVVEDPTGNKGPYAYKGNQWVGYDDVNMARKKAQYILDLDLGGAMFWDLPSDDFNNRCGSGRYPIISAVNDVLRNSNC